MPRFHLEIEDSYHLDDEEGQELADLEAARQEAINSIRSIMKEEIGKGRLPLRECIQILDSERRLLDTIYFRDAIRIEE